MSWGVEFELKECRGALMSKTIIFSRRKNGGKSCDQSLLNICEIRGRHLSATVYIELKSKLQWWTKRWDNVHVYTKNQNIIPGTNMIWTTEFWKLNIVIVDYECDVTWLTQYYWHFCLD